MLVTRYLFKNLLNATVFIALTLALIILLTQTLKLLELVAISDAPPVLFIKLVGLTLSKFMEIILPLSLVIAVLFTYNRLIMDNELIVLRASGVDQYALARPALILATITSLIVLFLSTWVTPVCAGKTQALRQEVRTQYSAFLLREGVFNTFSNNLTVYLRKRNDNGDMTGLVIHDTRDKEKPPVTILAKKGRVVMNGDIPNIEVFEGMRQQMDPDTHNLSKLYFSRYTIEISGLKGTEQARWRDADERTLTELFNPDMSQQRDRASRDLFLAEANDRLVTPWNALGFTAVALASVLLGPFNRRGQHKKVLFGAALVVLLQILNLVLINLSKKYLGTALLLPVNTFAPLAIGLYCLHLTGEQKLGALIRRWNAYVNRQAEARIA